MKLNAWLDAHYDETGVAKWLSFTLECIAGITLFGLMILTCADVIGRYFFNNSINGATELTELAIAIMIFAVMPVITLKGGHVVVDILDSFLGNKLIKLFTLISYFFISFAFYSLAERMLVQAGRAFRRELVTEYLALPVAYIIEYIAFMSYLTAGVLIIFGLSRLLKATPTLST